MFFVTHGNTLQNGASNAIVGYSYLELAPDGSSYTDYILTASNTDVSAIYNISNFSTSYFDINQNSIWSTSHSSINQLFYTVLGKSQYHPANVFVMFL